MKTYYNLYLMLGMGVVSAFELSAITLVILFHTGENAAAIAAIIGIGVSFQGFLGTLMLRDNHLAMNSRLDQLIEAKGRASRAEGHAEGITEEQDRVIKH